MLVRSAVIALALGSMASAAPGRCRRPKPKSTEAVDPSDDAFTVNNLAASVVPSAVSSSAVSVTPTSAASNSASPSPQIQTGGKTAVAKFAYGQEKIRGVNLGGWLVLEPWITPSLFDNTGNDDIIDEWSFGELQDRSTALAALKKHWDTWITEDDFKQIAAAGLNHVRLPIGYWAYDDDPAPYLPGQAEYVDKAVDWARTHNVKIMLELHGAPGSQNGFDNSGHRIDEGMQWHRDQKNIDRGRNVLNIMAKKYAGSDVVTSLGLLNEPATFRDPGMDAIVRQYWRDAYAATRYPNGESSEASDFLLVISDGFTPTPTYNGFMTPPEYNNVALDTHFYTVFGNDQVAWDPDTRFRAVCNKGGEMSQATTWLIVGEWSLASSDCAQYLNGRGRGSRYQGELNGAERVGSCSERTGDGANFTDDYKQFMRQFYDVQVQVYEQNGQGWVYWCWKNENAADWSYQSGLKLGYIPSNPETHEYPAPC